MKLAEYFKSNEGFTRLLNLLKEKYVSIGRFSGTVTITNLTKKESETFTDFFCRTFKEGSTVKISFKDIERANKGTIYENISWQDVFENYFNTKIITKKEKKTIERNDYETFIYNIDVLLDEEEQIFWKSILNEKEINSLIFKRYHKDKDILSKELINIIKLIVNLEDYAPISLVMLASKTGNPHFLDVDSTSGKLFIKLLSLYYKKEIPKIASERNKFFESLGIFVDEVSNFCITYNLNSDKGYLNDFYFHKEIVNLNLSNLHNINLSSSKGMVFVFENPSLVEYLKNLNISMVITSGIPNIATLKVLELLIKSGNTIYYNGDFDPEGLLIAQSLKNKYPEIKLFCYKESDYANSISDNYLSDSRINKLSKIKEKELLTIRELLIKSRRCAYQEKNIYNIERFIKRKIN